MMALVLTMCLFVVGEKVIPKGGPGRSIWMAMARRAQVENPEARHKNAFFDCGMCAFRVCLLA